MTRKRRRLYALLAALSGLGIATALVPERVPGQPGVLLCADRRRGQRMCRRRGASASAAWSSPTRWCASPTAITVVFRITDTRTTLPVT